VGNYCSPWAKIAHPRGWGSATGGLKKAAGSRFLGFKDAFWLLAQVLLLEISAIKDKCPGEIKKWGKEQMEKRG